jgi:glycosyltransferase involved in cell wall biosynthesis
MPFNLNSRPSMSEDDVGIIMRTRDRPVFLARAVESVLRQQYEGWRLVIVNNGEEGPVREVLDRSKAALRRRVTVVQEPHRESPSRIGRLTNKGLRAVDSRWVTVLDDDDTWHPTFLGRAIERLTVSRRHPNVRGVVTQSMVVNEVLEDGIPKVRSVRDFNPGLRCIELMALAASNPFTCNSFVYERAVLDELGLYDETLPVLDDWEFNLRFAQRFDIDVIPEPLAFYHQREQVDDTNAAMQNTPAEQHQFFYNKIVNDRLRTDLMKGQSGLGTLMAVSSKLKAMSEKIGRIDQRTRDRTKSTGGE